MPGALRLVALWASLLAAAPEAPEAPDVADVAASGLLLDRIVAVVDTQTVTQAELVAEARLALVRRAQSAAVASAVRLDGAFLHDFLSYLIGQMLVAREARRVGAEEVPDGEVEQAFGQLVAHFGTEAKLDSFLADLGVQRSFVRDVLRRERTNEHYLGQRLRTRLAGMGVRANDSNAVKNPRVAAQRAAALRTFLPAYLQELRQAVAIRRLTPAGTLEREQRR